MTLGWIELCHAESRGDGRTADHVAGLVWFVGD